MIDFDATICRICLEDGAIYPIFESNEEFESVYGQLAVCLQQKLENIEGYPQHICSKCKNTSDILSNFIATYEKTNYILKSKISHVKIEINEETSDVNNDVLESDHFMYELEINNIKPKIEVKDPTELLESLSHLTVKRIKVESNLDSEEPACIKKENDGRKTKGQPRKTATKRGRSEKAKKTIAKPTAVKRTVKTAATKRATAKQATVNNNGVNKQSSKDIAKPAEEKKDDRSLFLNLLKSFKQKPNSPSSEKKPAAAIRKLCDLCGMVYKNADQLARHKVYVHREKSHKCTQCPKTYSTGRQLKFHFLRHHENVKEAVCDYCGKSFFAKNDVKKHIETIHLKKKRKVSVYKCRFCEKSFSYKKGATIHERSVHTGERPATCDVCGNSFYDENYLKEHMRLHTGDTPYKCPVCARGYAQRGNMKSHMRNHRISELDTDTLAKIKPSYFKFMRP